MNLSRRNLKRLRRYNTWASYYLAAGLFVSLVLTGWGFGPVCLIIAETSVLINQYILRPRRRPPVRRKQPVKKRAA